MKTTSRKEELLTLCSSYRKRVVIITDSKVAPLYGKELCDQLQGVGLDSLLLSFPEGEKSKNRETKKSIEDELLARGYGKDTLLIALGGGVVTDLVGFVAATYLRGVPYLSIPTSLIGMVDASIGGKTGINTKWGKNTLGAIYLPDAIYTDFTYLKTLPYFEKRAGLAEIIKCGLILSFSLFRLIERNIERWFEWDLSFIQEIAEKSALIKKKIVSSDLKDKGERRLLNFGHTLGHAIERVEEYSISHGEAVAIGITFESLLSVQLGYLSHREFEEIYALFKQLGFPFTLSEKVTVDALFTALKWDKKNKGGHIRCVLLSSIGKALPFEGSYCTPIEESILREILTLMVKECLMQV